MLYNLGMNLPRTMQGRWITQSEIELIRTLIEQNSTWSRYRLSRELATHWNWYSDAGQLKDMACRTLLNKLHELEYIQLPPRRRTSPNQHRLQPPAEVEHDSSPLNSSLSTLRPLRMLDCSKPENSRLFSFLLDRYHYLGYRQPVGENHRYLVAAQDGRLLACLVFGAAAWKCADRDNFIGWTQQQRQVNLQKVVNNQRFLILPWVTVPHLASHILGLIRKRIADDWQRRYCHPIHLLETFVEQERFRGTCYRAANWQCVGQTSGRSRQDRYSRLCVPIKDIYTLPLNKRWRKDLQA